MDLQQAFDRGFETVKAYVDAELGALSGRIAAVPMLPPDLAEQVASAARLLHQSPLIEVRNDGPARIARIERHDNGALVPVYEEPRP